MTTFSSTDTGTFYRFEFDILERGTLLTFIPRSDQNETTASNSVSFDIIIRNPLLIIFYADALAFIDSKAARNDLHNSAIASGVSQAATGINLTC